MSTPSIAVIGGGIAGLGPAWRLALRGWDVHLFERHQIGHGASTKAAGMLAPTSEVTFEEEDLLRLGQISLTAYPQWVEELTQATDADLDYRTDGTLIVAVDRDDAEALEHLYQYHQRLQLPVERLLGREARKLEPGLSPTINYALFSPHDHRIDPVAMVHAMADALRAAGGTIHEQVGIAELRLDDQGIREVVTDDGDALAFATVLIAAGPWSPQIAGLPKGALPRLRPVRGQVVCVELGRPPLLSHVLRAPDAYLVPRSDGRLIIGSTMEERGFDPRLTAGGLFEILRGAWEALPGIYDAPILDTWTGFRPLTLANRPVLGPSTVDGLYLSTGHGRNGILLTPVSAYGLAELIDTGELPDHLLPFQL